MDDKHWFKVLEQAKDSVLQLICTEGVYNPFRPQFPPIDKKVSGTGFIVDITNGLVITNAHVIADTLSISGRMTRLGEYDLSLRVVSICREKDIALCQLCKRDIELILRDKTPDAINMIFGDNMLLRETSAVVAIGFPLGQKNIKFTTGVVSGFYANNTGEEEELFLTEEEEPSYIQITAPINPGNSGGPLVNYDGKVVGVNAAGYMHSQNIAYAIGARTVLGIYDELLRPLREYMTMPAVLITPKYSFEYNRTNITLLSSECHHTNITGVYTKRVYPNTCFPELQEADIITAITYEDPYLDNPAAFQVVNRHASPGRISVADLDQYGNLVLRTMCTETNTMLCRKLSLKELFDIIPIGTKIILTLCRKGQLYTITVLFTFIPSSVRNLIYPRIHPFKYLIVAGMSFGELTINHINMEHSLKEYARGKKRYHPVIVINQIFPDTNAYHTNVFKEGSIIKSINGLKVSTLTELHDAFARSDEYIYIRGRDHTKFIVSKEQAIAEDRAVVKQFGLEHYTSPLVS